ncbi:MAG: hypothetical protein R2731_02675 [Nocardioides sp.]
MVDRRWHRRLRRPAGRELGHQVLVVDPSPDALAALARRAESGVTDRVTGVQGDPHRPGRRGGRSRPGRCGRPGAVPRRA